MQQMVLPADCDGDGADRNISGSQDRPKLSGIPASAGDTHTAGARSNRGSSSNGMQWCSGTVHSGDSEELASSPKRAFMTILDRLDMLWMDKVWNAQKQRRLDDAKPIASFRRGSLPWNLMNRYRRQETQQRARQRSTCVPPQVVEAVDCGASCQDPLGEHYETLR